MTEDMTCLQLKEWGGRLRRNEVPVPSIGPGEVLVDVEATGIGRTVWNYIGGDMGDDAANLPRIPGHEVVGSVSAVGPGVTHLEPGDRVTVYFHFVCGHCRSCLAGSDPLCDNHRGWVGIDLDGGYAEFVQLPAGQVISIPSEIDPVAATTIPDAVATPYHIANQRASIGPGDRVAVIGAGGGVGIHMVQVARHFGGSVTAIDIDAAKLDRCRELGAEHTVNVRNRTPADSFDPPGRGFDAIVDFVGDTDLLEAAVEALGPRGTVVNLTSFPDNRLGVSPRQQVMAESSVVGSRYCSKYEIVDAAELVANGVVEPVVTEVVGFDRVGELLEAVAANEIIGRGAMVPE